MKFGGNIVCLECSKPSDIRLEIRLDKDSEFFQWFYFRLSGGQGQDCALKIINAAAATYPRGWENYRAVAILTHDGVVPYLDKFAVTPRAQGEGLGRSIWLRMRHDNPSLFWRSRSSNPINNWYFQQAEGSYTQHPWTVFWYGIETFEKMRDCVEQALAMPATLAEPM